MPDHHATPLKFLAPGWFAIVMGWSGLSLAWYRATPLMGDWAGAASMVAAGFAALVFALLLGASVVRWRRYPQALAEDLRHPVRHAFVAVSYTHLDVYKRQRCMAPTRPAGNSWPHGSRLRSRAVPT